MEYRKYLSDNKLELLQCTQLSRNVLERSMLKNILSLSDVVQLNCEPCQVERNFLFWNIIGKTNDLPWEFLIDVFSQARQPGVARLLENAERDDARITVYREIATRTLVPLEVSVKKRDIASGEVYVHSDDGYMLDDENIGLALVINITEFDTQMFREGADKDYNYMTSLWAQMGYKVYKLNGRITAAAFNEIIDNFIVLFGRNKKRTPGSCVVFIGSHGNDGRITTSDEVEVNLYDEVLRKFNNYSELKKIPKLFFIQACQYFPSESAGLNESNVRTELEDTLVCFSTQPGDGSNRCTRVGSYFVHSLTDVFMQEAYQKELKDLLSQVRQHMIGIDSPESTIQVSYFQAFRLKPLYFNLTKKVRHQRG